MPVAVGRRCGAVQGLRPAQNMAEPSSPGALARRPHALLHQSAPLQSASRLFAGGAGDARNQPFVAQTVQPLAWSRSNSEMTDAHLSASNHDRRSYSDGDVVEVGPRAPRCAACRLSIAFRRAHEQKARRGVCTQIRCHPPFPPPPSPPALLPPPPPSRTGGIQRTRCKAPHAMPEHRDRTRSAVDCRHFRRHSLPLRR